MDANDERPPGIDPAALAELDAVIARIMRGERDPEAMRRAAERMDRAREEIARRIGIVDFAVPTIRALRDGDDEDE